MAEPPEQPLAHTSGSAAAVQSSAQLAAAITCCTTAITCCTTSITCCTTSICGWRDAQEKRGDVGRQQPRAGGLVSSSRQGSVRPGVHRLRRPLSFRAAPALRESSQHGGGAAVSAQHQQEPPSSRFGASQQSAGSRQQRGGAVDVAIGASGRCLGSG